MRGINANRDRQKGRKGFAGERADVEYGGRCPWGERRGGVYQLVRRGGGRDLTQTKSGPRPNRRRGVSTSRELGKA